MNNDFNLKIISTSSTYTQKIGEQIGRLLKGKETIILSSDLGGGKTVFTKGLTKGAGSVDLVSSPTFTISKIYKCPNFDIHHFDFYRLDDPGIISLELVEVMSDEKSVAVIEWADIVRKILPSKYLQVVFDQLGDDKRLINIICPSELNYLIKDVK
jgi:tRNA threonylcarbamoyladenosine biosynthesis protein TsaE